jgi:flagellar hook-associated protein 1 FlgK
MSIQNAMNNALSGLTATARMSEIVSNNISNSTNEGYSRQEVILAQRVAGSTGAGVSVTGVNRVSDPALLANRRTADAAFELQSTLSTAFTRLADLAGVPGGDNALPEGFIADLMVDFENALRDLAASPETETLQSQAVDAARDIALELNRLADESQTLREQADTAIANQVETINDNLARIEVLNRDILILNATGKPTAALEDQRKALVDQINTIVPVRVLPRDEGVIGLTTKGGALLLEGSPNYLSFTATPVITSDLSFAAGDLSGVTFSTSDVAPGTGSRFLLGGSLEANFAIRDTTIPEFDAQIDALAQDLVERFEDPAVDTTLLAGDAGLFTDAGAALNLANLTGLAGRLSVNAAADPQQGGEARLLRDGMNSLAAGPAGSATIVNNFLSTMTTARTLPAGLGVAAPRSAANAALEFAAGRAAGAFFAETETTALSAQLTAISEQERATTGVDVDRQLSLLLLIEQAYSANARVIQTADQMLQRLLEI